MHEFKCPHCGRPEDIAVTCNICNHDYTDEEYNGPEYVPVKIKWHDKKWFGVAIVILIVYVVLVVICWLVNLIPRYGEESHTLVWFFAHSFDWVPVVIKNII